MLRIGRVWTELATGTRELYCALQRLDFSAVETISTLHGSLTSEALCGLTIPDLLHV